MNEKFKIQDSRAYKYALECINPANDKVGEYVKLQAQLWLNIADGKDPAAYIDLKIAKKIIKLLKIIKHPDVEQPLYNSLEDYSILFIIALFCTIDVKDKQIYYQTGLLELGRKNYKTFTSGVIFVLAMLLSRRDSRFFSVAPTRDAATELKLAAAKIIEYNESLSMFKVFKKEIRCTINNNDYKTLACSNDKLDSRTCQLFLVDEIGALDAYPVLAMRKSQISVKDKMGILISTRYPSTNNVMITELDKAKKILNGAGENNRYFALLFEPDQELTEGDAWKTDDKVIYQANPVSINNKMVFDAIKDMRSDAVVYEDYQQDFLTKNCNIDFRGLGVLGFVPTTFVKKCAGSLPDSWWAGRKVYLGMDLSQSDDNTSVSMLTYDAETDMIYCKSFCFLPKNKIMEKTKKENIDYSRMVREGYAIECGKETIDYKMIEDFVIGLKDKYKVKIAHLGYDRYNAMSSVQKLIAAGIPCVEVRQHSDTLHPATVLIKEHILNCKFTFDKNTLYIINYENCRCRKDSGMRMFVDKLKSSGKVDMVVSTITAASLLNAEEILNQKKVWAC